MKINDDGFVDNLIFATILFIIYLVVAVILFCILSNPVNIFLNAMMNNDINSVTSGAMSSFIPGLVWGVNVALALFLALPITWFIMWVFQHEVDFSFYRRI